jgi:hypothetical protein
MTINTGNVIVGAAQMYFAPWGEATVGEGEPMPADTVPLGTPWGGNWVAIGGTEQGVKFTANPKIVKLMIEEQRTPADVVVDTEDVTVITTLSEDTLANMKLAYGGGAIVTQAATGTVIGKSTLTLSDTLDTLSVGFEAVNAFGYFRRVYVPKVISAASVDTTYRRAAKQRLYPVTLSAICDPTLIVIVDQTAPVT